MSNSEIGYIDSSNVTEDGKLNIEVVLNQSDKVIEGTILETDKEDDTIITKDALERLANRVEGMPVFNDTPFIQDKIEEFNT
jgi:hypothetical protein